MNSFDKCSKVEAQGIALLKPYLEERSDGNLVMTNKGDLARHLQLTAGDILINDHRTDGSLRSVEIKTEVKHTGNLFLETWSNRNLDDRAGHIMWGSNRGWLDHSRADMLLYLFLDNLHLYAVDFIELKRWAYGYGDQPGNIYQYPEVKQRKHDQRNDSLGRLVPVDYLALVMVDRFRHAVLPDPVRPRLVGASL